LTHHRRSSDCDHGVTDLRDRFDDVLSSLEAAAGWRTERFQKPVLILGAMDGILTGIRQLRRTRPLETEEREGLRVPTLAEMARIKAEAAASCDFALRAPFATYLSRFPGSGSPPLPVSGRMSTSGSNCLPTRRTARGPYRLRSTCRMSRTAPLAALVVMSA
jgi:hypothetical protein